jgi:hypothetical protein
MTPEQVALKALRQRNSALEALCATAGKPLYEAHAYRPAEVDSVKQHGRSGRVARGNCPLRLSQIRT